MSILVGFILLLIMSGCANYQFGSISKAYCGTASPEMRAQIRATAEKGGIVFDIDYCASVGLIDAIIIRDGE